MWCLNRLGEKCKCNKRIYFLLAVNGYITHFFGSIYRGIWKGM
jgi:hypothetical protein